MLEGATTDVPTFAGAEGAARATQEVGVANCGVCSGGDGIHGEAHPSFRTSSNSDARINLEHADCPPAPSAAVVINRKAG